MLSLKSTWITSPDTSLVDLFLLTKKFNLHGSLHEKRTFNAAKITAHNTKTQFLLNQLITVK